jgi:KDO2-lipid IV(A) lauroyltransferase
VRAVRLWIAVMALLFSWPSLHVLQRAGRTLGQLAWFVAPRSRQVTQRNIGLCLPSLAPDAQAALARASMAATGQLLLESAAVWSRSPESLASWVIDVTGKDALDAAIAEGRGLLCLVPHFGNWELLNAWLGSHYDFTAMYAPRRNRWAEAWVRRSRQRSGSSLVPTTRAGVRALFEALARGGVVGIMPDQVPDDGAGVRSIFFGQPALTGTLPARLALRAKSPLFIAWSMRADSPARRAGFHIGFRRLVAAEQAQDVPSLLALVGAEVEQVVELQPAQYQWEYKRFKHATPGIDVYKHFS